MKGGITNMKTAKILCIEDENDLRNDIVAELSEEGFEVIEAANGQQGLEAILNHRPDLILCDIMMPGMTGIQLLETVRERRIDPSVPFIFITALNDKEHINATKQLGAACCIMKPVDFKSLTETIRSSLTKRDQSLVVANQETEYARLTGVQDHWNAGISAIDPATELPTERTLHLAQSAWSAKNDKLFPHCAMMIDIANMSETNSLFGYAAGNGLYRRIGQRLQGMMKRFFPRSENGDENYIIARMAVGDFGIVIYGEVDQDGIECVAKELARAVAEPITEGTLQNFSASIRIGAYEGRTDDVAETLKGAKRAIRDAKRKGDNLVMLFKHAARSTDGEFMTSDLKAEMPRALRGGELELYYQPRIHTSASHVACVEALIRWNHPDFGLVSPEHFIPDAEDSGLIVTIGDWVLKEACTQGVLWCDKNALKTKIAVNISPIQFGQKQFVGRVAEILRETGLSAQYLEIEITESTYLVSKDATSVNIKELRNMGVSVAIDDFGTGFANLVYLKYLNADTVKIDRVFVAGIVNDTFDSAVAESILRLGMLRHMNIVAEGVETIEQVEHLRKLGCEEFQGFLYSAPVPAHKVPKLVQKLTNPSLVAAH